MHFVREMFFGGKIDDSEQMTEINILLKQIWQAIEETWG